MNLLTYLIVLAAISLVSAGIFSVLLPIDWPLMAYISVLLICIVMIVTLGHYDLFSKLTKYMVISLSLLSLIAVSMALKNNFEVSRFQLAQFDWTSAVDLAFLLALIGWMPAPLEISAWHSSWMLAEKKERNFKSVHFDFKVGYWGTMILALIFMSLGALVMFGKESSFSTSAVGFSSQMIELFTAQFGSWSFPLIALIAFATMFSTMLTCFDAYPRILVEGGKILGLRIRKGTKSIVLLISALLVGAILYFFLGNIKAMVDFATIVSFFAAIFIASFNFIVALRLNREGLYPKGKLRWILMILGILSLAIFALVYLMT